MTDYEYVVKEGDTLQSLSEAFYSNPDHSQYLAKFNLNQPEIENATNFNG